MAMKAEARRCAGHFRAEYADTMCRIGEVLLSFSSATLTLITFGTTYWIQAAKNENEPLFHGGLWQNCSISDTVDCKRLAISGPAYLIASRLFMTLALISCVLSALLSVVGLLQHNYKWLFAATGAYAVQAFFSLLGLASFSPGFKQPTDPDIHRRSGWSYNVGWISMVVSIVCAIYFVSVGLYRLKNPTTNTNRSESRSYAPLAQLESTDSDDDYDDDL